MKQTSKNLKCMLITVGLITATFSSCKKDNDLVKVPPPDQNEIEIITTFTIKLTDINGVEPEVSATFQDLDESGGNAPTQFDEIILAPNTTYTAQIILLNETNSPTDTISNEVLEEADEHLFCFTPSAANVVITRIDTDGTYEIGLQSKWVTDAASTGTTQITLKHQPDLKDGTCAPGETDIELEFTTKIQ